MRYIRTKYGSICDVKKYSWLDIDDDGNYHLWHKPEFSCLYHVDIDKEDIVKTSDTIEELCDQFVFVDDFYLLEHRVCHSFENAIALSKIHNVDIKTFRGAIWTDRGLIYVAKMNDKGELELL